MLKYSFRDLSLKTLKSIVKLEPKGIADYVWTEVAHIPITEEEKFQLKRFYLTFPTHCVTNLLLLEGVKHERIARI